MTIEEACAASSTGIAHGYDSDGVYQFAAQGPSLAPWPPNHRQPKHVVVWPALLKPGRRPIVDGWTPHLHRKLFRVIKPEVRAKLDALDWRPAHPVDIVTALARGKRR